MGNTQVLTNPNTLSSSSTEVITQEFMPNNRDLTISSKVNDKVVTVHPNNDGYLPMHKFSGVESCYLTTDNGQIFIHGSRGGQIPLKCDKRGKYHMNFDNGIAVFSTQRYY